MEAFCVDLDQPLARIEVCEYSPELLAEEMEDFGVEYPSHLSDYDRMVFDTDPEAEAFLERYKVAYQRLTDPSLCFSRELPALAYRTRYLTLLLMGVKLTTSRTYRRDWMPGDLFNLHDRKHFVTVRLLSIKEDPEGYRYYFELA